MAVMSEKPAELPAAELPAGELKNEDDSGSGSIRITQDQPLKEPRAKTTPAEPDPEPAYITGARLYMVLSAMTLAVFLLFVDTGILATAIPRITDEFKSLPDVGWYGGAYQLCSAAITPLSGKIFQRFSLKWSYVAFFALFELGSVLCGCATSSNMLIVGRAVAGMGGAGLFSGAMTIIVSALPLEKRAVATGVMLGCSQMGTVIGPLLGGVFTELTTWRWCFWINLPVGAVCLVILGLVSVPDQVKKPKALDVLHRLHHELDLVGFVLFAGAAIMLLLALEFGGNQHPWNSSTVIGLFVGAGTDFAVWLVWNYRAGDGALLPVSMVTKRAVWASSVMQGTSMAAVFTTTYYLPVFFQAVQDASALTSGIHLLPTIVSQLLLAVISGAMVSRTGYTIPYAFIGGIFAVVGVGLLSTLSPSSGMGNWFGYQVLAGLGRGTAMQMPMIAVQAVLKPSELSMANSLLMFSIAISSSITLVVGNAVLDQSLRSEVPKYAPGVNVDAIITAGATGFRKVVSLSDLPGVVDAYAKSIDNIFYISAACAAVAVVASLGLGWVDIRKKPAKTPDAPDAPALEAGEKNQAQTQ